MKLEDILKSSGLKPDATNPSHFTGTYDNAIMNAWVESGGDVEVVMSKVDDEGQNVEVNSQLSIGKLHKSPNYLEKQLEALYNQLCHSN